MDFRRFPSFWFPLLVAFSVVAFTFLLTPKSLPNRYPVSTETLLWSVSGLFCIESCESMLWIRTISPSILLQIKWSSFPCVTLHISFCFIPRRAKLIWFRIYHESVSPLPRKFCAVFSRFRFWSLISSVFWLQIYPEGYLCILFCLHRRCWFCQRGEYCHFRRFVNIERYWFTPCYFYDTPLILSNHIAVHFPDNQYSEEPSYHNRSVYVGIQFFIFMNPESC